MLPPVVGWAVAAVLVALAALLMARAISRLADWRSRDDVEEVRDFVWSWSGLRRQLHGLMRPGQDAVASAAKERGLAEEADDAVSAARALYRQLLRLGAQLGRRRSPSETPDEYERALGQVERLSPRRVELRILTALYRRARYASEPPTEANLRAARSALAAIQELEEPT